MAARLLKGRKPSVNDAPSTPTSRSDSRGSAWSRSNGSKQSLASTQLSASSSFQERSGGEYNPALISSLAAGIGSAVIITLLSGASHEGVIDSVVPNGVTAGVTLKDVQDPRSPMSALRESCFFPASSIVTWSHSFRTEADLDQFVERTLQHSQREPTTATLNLPEGSNSKQEKHSNPLKSTWASLAEALYNPSKKDTPVPRASGRTNHSRPPSAVSGDAPQSLSPSVKKPAVMLKTSVLPAVPIKTQNIQFGSIDVLEATLSVTATPPTARNLEQVKTFGSVSAGSVDAQPEDSDISLPVMRDPPTAQEITGSAYLMEELHARGAFESTEGLWKRGAIINHLPKLIEMFGDETFAQKGFPLEATGVCGCKIIQFGSHRLGVHGPGSDIDVLIVAPTPMHMDRQDFTEIFLGILEKDSWVTDARAVSEAYALVPIIVAKIGGLRVDFAFARLNQMDIPDDLDLTDDVLYHGLDEKCVRSLNGPRCADEILRLVPVVHIFRDALRAIRFWAQQRAIYSNMSGFLGGVSWAILVAHICQLYPDGNMATIVRQFFRIMSNWKWPRPVMLQKFEDSHLNNYRSNDRDIMPIITPVQPPMCSSRSVMACTLEVVKEEMNRGRDITTRALNGETQWSELFEKHNFFTRYRHYLQVIASSCDKIEQFKWAALVQSRLRRLVSKLESTNSLARIHPFVKGFDKVYYTSNTQEYEDAVQGYISPIVASRTEKDATAQAWHEFIAVHVTVYYVGLEFTNLGPAKTNKEAQKMAISGPVKEFTELVKGWGSCRIAVQHIKDGTLPEREYNSPVAPTASAGRPQDLTGNSQQREYDSTGRLKPRLDIHRLFQQSTEEPQYINPFMITTNGHSEHEQEPWDSEVPPATHSSEYIEGLAPVNLDSQTLPVDPQSHRLIQMPIEGTLMIASSSSIPTQPNPHAQWLRRFPGMSAADKRPLVPLSILQEELTFKKRLFAGNYSDVHCAEWKGELVAVKILRGLNLSTQTMDRKRQRELTTWWELDHPSVLPLLGFIEDIEPFGPLGAMVSPFCRHGSVLDYLENTPLDYFRRIILWSQVLEGMAHLHGNYPMIIHGDLKPANILIDEDGHVRICDFGLARLIVDRGNSGLTTTTAYTGTTRYKSPELFHPNAKQTVASDVYALGCLGLEFVFLRAPYHRLNDSMVIARDIRAGKPPAKRPRKPPPEVGYFWDQLQACWEREPSERPTTTSICQHVRRYGAALAEELEEKQNWLDY